MADINVKMDDQSEVTKSVSELGSIPNMKTSNAGPTTGTTAEPNALKCEVQVGRRGDVTGVAPDNLESLRPGADGKNG